MTAYPGFAGLARSPFVLTEHISSMTYVPPYIYIYIYIYIRTAPAQICTPLIVSRSLRLLANNMYGRYVCHNSSACHAYVMWAELHHCHFVYVPGTGTKNVLKWNRALGFEFSIQSSVYGATTVAKVSLFYTWTRCTVSFYSM